MMIAFLVSELFLMALEALKAVTKKRWAVISDAIIVYALVSVTVNGQQRPALSISSRVQKYMLTDMNRHRRMRTNTITMWGFWRLIFRIWNKLFISLFLNFVFSSNLMHKNIFTTTGHHIFISTLTLLALQPCICLNNTSIVNQEISAITQKGTATNKQEPPSYQMTGYLILV